VKFRTWEKISNIYKWKEEVQRNTQFSICIGGRQKVQITKFAFDVFVVGSLLSVLLPTRSAQRLSSPHLAAVLRPNLAELVPSVFFLSTATVFAAVRTNFPKKNTRVYRNTVTCVTRVTSNRVEVHRLNSQHLAMVRTSDMAELLPSGIFCLQPWFLQRSKHIFLRKTPVFMLIQLQSINSCLRVTAC